MKFKIILFIGILITITAFMNSPKETITVFETSRGGNQLTQLTNFTSELRPSVIALDFEKEFQTISGLAYCGDE